MSAENFDPIPNEERAAYFRARGIAPRRIETTMIERTQVEQRDVHPARAAYFRAKLRAARNAPTRTNRTRGGLFVTDAMLRDWQARR